MYVIHLKCSVNGHSADKFCISKHDSVQICQNCIIHYNIHNVVYWFSTKFSSFEIHAKTREGIPMLTRDIFHLLSGLYYISTPSKESPTSSREEIFSQVNWTIILRDPFKVFLSQPSVSVIRWPTTTTKTPVPRHHVSWQWNPLEIQKPILQTRKLLCW